MKKDTNSKIYIIKRIKDLYFAASLLLLKSYSSFFLTNVVTNDELTIETVAN